MLRRRSRRRPRRGDRRGAVLVEMAFILPILVTVTLGIVEFGRGMMVGQLVTNAAREGARLGVLDGSTNADVTAFVEEFLLESVNVSADSVDVTITVEPASGNPDPGNEVGNASAKDLVTVRVQVPFDQVSYVTGKWLTGKKLVGHSAMRHE